MRPISPHSDASLHISLVRLVINDFLLAMASVLHDVLYSFMRLNVETFYSFQPELRLRLIVFSIPPGKAIRKAINYESIKSHKSRSLELRNAFLRTFLPTTFPTLDRDHLDSQQIRIVIKCKSLVSFKRS